MALKLSFALVVALCLGLSNGAIDCPCSLLESVRYPGTSQWNCESLGLTSVPGECYEIADNVTEVYLTDNNIAEVRNIDFAGLSDLKALYVNYNDIDFFDPTALAGISHLEFFHGEQNFGMEFPSKGLYGKKELKEVIIFSTGSQTLPDLTEDLALEKLDARSCQLTTIPRPLFSDSLTSSTFVLSLFGNTFVDIAADILLPLPIGATLNFDSYVTIWAKDQFEKYDFIDKNFVINIDLDTNLRVCDYDGTPTDATMC